VIVDDDGFERVVAGSNRAEGFVYVHGKSDDPHGHHYIALMASEASTEPRAELIAVARGETVCVLGAIVDGAGPVCAGLHMQDVLVGEDGPELGESVELAPHVLSVGDVCVTQRRYGP